MYRGVNKVDPWTKNTHIQKYSTFEQLISITVSADILPIIVNDQTIMDTDQIIIDFGTDVQQESSIQSSYNDNRLPFMLKEVRERESLKNQI